MTWTPPREHWCIRNAPNMLAALGRCPGCTAEAGIVWLGTLGAALGPVAGYLLGCYGGWAAVAREARIVWDKVT